MNKIIDKNILKVMISYIFSSKTIIISFILLFILSTTPMLLFINSNNFEQLYIKRQLFFVISPFVSQIIFISLLAVRTSVATKNNNLDLYIRISNNTKFKILMTKQFTIFFIGLLTLIGPILNTIILFSLMVSSADNYFITIFWVLFQLIIYISIVLPIINIIKKFILSFSITILFSIIWSVGICSPLFLHISKKNEGINNNYRLLNLNSQEKTDTSENVIINYSSNNKFKNTISIASYIPFIGAMGNSLSSTLSKSKINQKQREEILNDNLNYATASMKLIYNDPNDITIGNNSVIVPPINKSIFDYDSQTILFSDLEKAFEKEIMAKEKNNSFWQDILRNLQSQSYISNVILSSEEKSILEKSIGINNDLIKQLFIYKKHLVNTNVKFLDYLQNKNYSIDFINYLKFIFLNEDTRFQIIKLDALGLPTDYYYPNLSLLDIYKDATNYDLKYLSSILFKPNFDGSDQITNVDYLNNKNSYTNMNNWANFLIIDNSSVTDKNSWDDYWKNNAEVTNLETIILNARRQFSDISQFKFSDNVSDKLAVSKKYHIEIDSKFNYLQLIYSAAFITLAIAIQLFAKYRLNRKDVL